MPDRGGQNRVSRSPVDSNGWVIPTESQICSRFGPREAKIGNALQRSNNVFSFQYSANGFACSGIVNDERGNYHKVTVLFQ